MIRAVITQSMCRHALRSWRTPRFWRKRHLRVQAVLKRSFRRRSENLFPCRALTTDVRKFLGSVFLQSRLKFYFEKQRPSFHTAWVIFSRRPPSLLTAAYRLIAAVPGERC